jgi:hypothetical protein
VIQQLAQQAGITTDQLYVIISAVPAVLSGLAAVAAAFTRRDVNRTRGDVQKQGVPENGDTLLSKMDRLSGQVAKVSDTLDAHIAGHDHPPAADVPIPPPAHPPSVPVVPWRP